MDHIRFIDASVFCTHEVLIYHIRQDAPTKNPMRYFIDGHGLLRYHFRAVCGNMIEGSGQSIMKQFSQMPNLHYSAKTWKLIIMLSCIFLMTFLFSWAFGEIDYYLVSKDRSPIFTFQSKTWNDGGTREFVGVGYRIFHMRRLTVDRNADRGYLVGPVLKYEFSFLWPGLGLLRHDRDNTVFIPEAGTRLHSQGRSATCPQTRIYIVRPISNAWAIASRAVPGVAASPIT